MGALESLTALYCRTEWELVAIDNDSADDTQALIGDFADSARPAIPGLVRTLRKPGYSPKV